MKVQAIPMSNLFDKCDDIYTTVVVLAKRTRQIIDQRVIPIDENEDVEDSIEFEEPIVATYMEKPESVSLQEFLNGELEWREANQNEQSEDES